MDHNHVCPWWLAYTFDNPIRTFFHKPEKMFSGYVKAGDVVADIGCGMGYFSISLAHMVKPDGKVYAIDIQTQMLNKVKKRAIKAGVSEHIITQLSSQSNLVFKEPVDFALAFWMIHETRDKTKFFKKIFKGLKNQGLLLVTEPKFHVSQQALGDEIKSAENAGFKVKDKPKISLSRSVLLEKI